MDRHRPPQFPGKVELRDKHEGLFRVISFVKRMIETDLPHRGSRRLQEQLLERIEPPG